MRTRTALGVVGLGLLALAMSDGEAVPLAGGGPGKPPSDVPWPEGWRRHNSRLDGSVTAEMSTLAKAAVNDSTTRLGQLVTGGFVLESGREWGVLIEWHYHPPGQGFSAEGWHKGATIVVRS